MESNPPVIQSRTWHVAKDTAFAAEYDDAFHVGADCERVAIADGVSSAIFSGRWARILTRAIVENPPDFSQPDGWVKWLAGPRQDWMVDIDFPRMPPHQKTKLRQVGGAYCTLCLAQFLPGIPSEDEVTRYQLRGYAMGDSCLLHIRDGQLVTSFPLCSSAEFDLDPDSICSVASSRDTQLNLKTVDIECQDADVIVLVTDAIGKWMFECLERGELAPWAQLWSLDESDWIATIDHLRDINALKRDDTTMVVLQVGAGQPAWDVPVSPVEQTPAHETEGQGVWIEESAEPNSELTADACPDESESNVAVPVTAVDSESCDTIECDLAVDCETEFANDEEPAAAGNDSADVVQTEEKDRLEPDPVVLPHHDD